jgi:predicted dinucleotide-binding enzyme
VAAEVMRGAGFEPVDAGPLRIARYIEPLAFPVGELAYRGTAGPELAYVFERFGKPQR